MLHLSALGLSSGRLGTLFLVACSLAAHLSNCQTQQPKTPDATPPTIRWHVANKDTTAAQDINGTGSVDAKPGERYTVTCVVNDPEGVHEITLGGAGDYTCVQGEIPHKEGFTRKTEKQELKPDNSNGAVLNQIFLIQNVDFDFKCESEFQFEFGKLLLNGAGQNYNGGNVESTLTFNIKP
jgi:hypothetical protein